MQRMTISNALRSLEDRGETFAVLFEHGSLAVEMYKHEKNATLPDQFPISSPLF
jgi:hypothetical protein